MVITNKKTSQYQILDRAETGVVLTGAETKAFYMGKVDLSRSYVRFISGRPQLVNAQFNHPSLTGDLVSKSRSLLMHKKEIGEFMGKLGQTGLTLLPIKMYNKGRFIKLEVGLARGLKQYEAREKLRKHDINRDTMREIKYGDD